MAVSRQTLIISSFKYCYILENTLQRKSNRGDWRNRVWGTSTLEKPQLSFNYRTDNGGSFRL